MNCLLVLVFLALATSELEARAAPYIIGGRTARVGEFPYQGSLQWMGAYNDGAEMNLNRHECGCVLISNLWVVTAAHCTDRGKDRLVVIMGMHERGNKNVGAPARYYIASLIRYPGYNDKLTEGDIALLRLQFPVTVNRYVAPIEMHARFTDLGGANCVISGWGYTKTDNYYSPAKILRAADVRALSTSECKAKYFGRASDRHICVLGDNRRGACTEDSGGPVVCKGKLAGVASYVQWGCQPSSPSVYTSIAHYRYWIGRYTGF